jgi:hypothetical protein
MLLYHTCIDQSYFGLTSSKSVIVSGAEPVGPDISSLIFQSFVFHVREKCLCILYLRINHFTIILAQSRSTVF